MEAPSFCFWALLCFAILLARYGLVAGLSYWWFYVRGRRRPAATRPSSRSIQADILLSVRSTGVFALATAGALHLHNLGWTRLYTQPTQYGLWYLVLSYGLALFLQDSFFYAAHRLCHHPALFGWTHRGHHRSRQPTPWTSFAFDLPEAALQALFLVALVVSLPLHRITLVAILATMTVWAVVNHLGLEVLPPWFPHHWLGRWLIGPAHHSIHHRHPTRHFGLYFTFWDWILGTQDPIYESRLAQPAHAQQPPAAEPSSQQG